LSAFQIPKHLKRYPARKRETLQAWDSADELILSHLSDIDLAGRRILIANDQFGALSCALRDLEPTVYTDSFLSYQATRLNSAGRISPQSELEALTGVYDLVLIRVPKNMSFFEDLLCHLSNRLSNRLLPGAQLICGYMVKHQANTSFELLAKIIGETRTSLARKKARLIFARFEKANATPSSYPIQLTVPGFEHPFVNHSNLFSREKLDIGTRFFLEHLPQGDFKTILDLGCANGIVGIAAKRLNPSARVMFSDESKMAILSARTNYARYFTDTEPAEFHWTNCFEDGVSGSVDLVLCNPPFHQGTTMGDVIARQMFDDAHRVLRPEGKIRVVGNTHLQYQRVLDRVFGNSEILATNSKFMIVEAVK